jgi:simple sugar transport system permease protein
MDHMETELIIAILYSAVRAGTPVLYATLGELLTERSGILNLGLEGIMLLGAMTAVAVNVTTGDALLSVMAAGLAGIALALIHAVVSIRMHLNQIVSGLALVFLGKGLSAFYGARFVGQQVPGVASWDVPLLADIPIFGRILFQQDIFVYFSYLLVGCFWFLLYRTRLGLQIRAAGEDPRSAAYSGVRVQRIRFWCLVVGAFLAAVGGAHLSLAYTQMWLQDMVAGRGWIAIGLVIFAMWHPLRAMFGAYLFGGLSSLQLNLQAQGVTISPYLLGMLPYLFTIVVLVLASWKLGKNRIGIPVALGKPYVPDY